MKNCSRNTKYTGMREVILSHDSEVLLCLVPSEVADNLEKYCLDFAANWVWHGPENGKYLKWFSEELVGAMFGAKRISNHQKVIGRGFMGLFH